MHPATIRLPPLRVACSLRAVPNALLTRLLVRAPALRRVSPAAVAAAPVRLLLCRGGTPACQAPPSQSPSTPRGGISLARRREGWRAFASAASSTTAEDAERDQRKPVEPVKRQRFDMVYDHVTLTDDERELFKLLLDTNEHFGLSTTLRAAGGWVRDKLLGKQSDDVDIALDNMLGKDFAEKVNEYLTMKGEEVHTVGVIQTNPEQSKHLETARVRIRGVWIDLVNLRSEEYAEESRIPTMAFGTPEQDAYRRDLTINAMFYNLNTASVEDFTNMGMTDLRAGIIRTPLAPRDTFLDDPLRVLRATRFSARFQFPLHEELMEAGALDEVRNALRDKVSKERVGTEVEGMLKSQDPVEAMRHLLRMRLFEVVFPVPPGTDLPEGKPYADACVSAMAAAHGAISRLPTQMLSPPETRLCLLAALLLPLREVTVPAKKKRVGLASHIVREELKLRTKDAELTAALHVASQQLLTVAAALGLGGLRLSVGAAEELAAQAVAGIGDATGGGGFPAHLCVAIGMVVRQLKEQWRLALPLMALHDLPCGTTLMNSAECTVVFDVAPHADESDPAEVVAAQRRAALCIELEGVVQAMGLQSAWEIKPLVDGKSVMAVLGMKQGGPALGKAMDRQLQWQLCHPTATQDECRAWMQANKDSMLG